MCKEYQVGGFAAAEPCTYVNHDRKEIIVYNVENVLRDLHPHAAGAFRGLTAHLYSAYENRKTASYFRPFEGLRPPIKQTELLNKRPAVTHVGPWHSAHQYGLAVDFVAFKREGLWSWDESEDWTFLRLSAEKFGLIVPIVWDMGHVEHPVWRAVQRLLFAKP